MTLEERVAALEQRLDRERLDRLESRLEAGLRQIIAMLEQLTGPADES